MNELRQAVASLEAALDIAGRDHGTDAERQYAISTAVAMADRVAEAVRRIRAGLVGGGDIGDLAGDIGRALDNPDVPKTVYDLKGGPARGGQ